MNVSIIGCTNFNDYQVLKWHLDELQISQITTCGIGEVENLALKYALEKNIKLIELWPGESEGWVSLWKEYYKSLDSCDVLLAFWFGDNNRVLKMINKAKQMGKEVTVIRGYHSDPVLFSKLQQ